MAEIGIDIVQAKGLLDDGQLVAIPTETVYGLAGNALDPLVVTRIFEVKKRPFFDPLIVHIEDLAQLKHLTKEMPAPARLLAEKFWPGPLTLVLSKTESVPDIVTSGLDTVAVRMPHHQLTLSLLKSLSYPLAAPSANPFGYISPTTAEHVQKQLGSEIPYILDGGPCEIGIESTIVGFWEGDAHILRQGGIVVDQIEALIGPVKLAVQSADPLAPGMLESHYAPNKKVLLGQIEELLHQHGEQSIGILSYNRYFEQVPADCQIMLSAQSDLKEAAKNLFAALRKLDAMAITHILVEPVPDHGLGQAINDRLRRAAS